MKAFILSLTIIICFFMGAAYEDHNCKTFCPKYSEIFLRPLFGVVITLGILANSDVFIATILNIMLLLAFGLFVLLVYGLCSFQK